MLRVDIYDSFDNKHGMFGLVLYWESDSHLGSFAVSDRGDDVTSVVGYFKHLLDLDGKDEQRVEVKESFVKLHGDWEILSLIVKFNL